LSPQIFIDLPSPTLQVIPEERRSFAAKKLRQMKEGLFPNSEAKKEEFGKYLALRIRELREWGN
jgi:hypothetical protein